VQGGTKGMGRAAAERFAADRARVVVLARGRPAIDETVGELEALGSPEAFGIAMDLTDGGAVSTAFAEIGERWGELNVLVNAAGPVDVGIGGFDDVDDDEWVATLDIGLLGAARCVRA